MDVKRTTFDSRPYIHGSQIRAIIKVYSILIVLGCHTALGAELHRRYNIGGPTFALNCMLFYWQFHLFKQKRLISLIFACMLFGASVGPFINLFIETPQSYVIYFFGLHITLFCFHILSLLTSSSLRLIFTSDLLNLPIYMTLVAFIPSYCPEYHPYFSILLFVFMAFSLGCYMLEARIWIWRVGIPINLHILTIMSIFSPFSLIHLMIIFVFLLFAIWNMNLHTVRCLDVAPEDSIEWVVVYAKSFFTEYIWRSAGMILLWVRILFLREWITTIWPYFKVSSNAKTVANLEKHRD
ncbi:uncharacterized protein [Rutidosis leptorrhynchoides]|uniref:uncharacterized protein n=1 Tax=Rutidosis leptorrhynchoides TaxID=125765 RepID=UPI003A9A1256